MIVSRYIATRNDAELGYIADRGYTQLVSAARGAQLRAEALEELRRRVSRRKALATL
jgi:hypothetical protein